MPITNRRRRVPEPKPKHAEEVYLERIQHKLMPDHADEIVAINTDTGEYVLGYDVHQAFAAFRSRWPDSAMYLCKVDGGPAVKFHGCRL
jgi:hypothetical protein